MDVAKKSSPVSIRSNITAIGFAKVQPTAGLESLVKSHLTSLSKTIRHPEATAQPRLGLSTHAALQSRGLMQMAGKLAQNRLQQQSSNSGSIPSRPPVTTDKASSLLRKQIAELSQQINNPPMITLAFGKQIPNPNAIKAAKEKLAKLVEDKNFLSAASPEEKAGMLKDLRRDLGGTGSLAPPAIAQAAYKVLASCTSKQEFDKTIDLAGGKDFIRSVPFAPLQELPGGKGAFGIGVPGHYSETLNKLNELASAWGRTDIATDKARAEKFNGALLEPRRSELSATRPPTSAEAGAVGSGIDTTGKGDPVAGQIASTVQQGLSAKAFDIDWDPQAKTELVLEQRRREVDGKPKLDLTSLAAQAEKIVNDPKLDKEAQDLRAKKRAEIEAIPNALLGAPKLKAQRLRALDETPDAELKRQILEPRMAELGKKNGVSEQTLKSLVTQRMGQIHGEAGAEMAAHGAQVSGQWKQQLAEIEKAKGKDSPEANALRTRIEQFEKTTGAQAQRLGETGGIYSAMLPVPPPPPPPKSFLEEISPVLDIVATCCAVIPGVGPAITAGYFGVKSAVAAAHGDMLGAFTNALSALPGVGSVAGAAAGQALATGARLTQAGIAAAKGIADGDPMAVLGGVAGAAGGLGDAGLGKTFESVSTHLHQAQAALSVVDGAARGDLGRMASGLSAFGSRSGPLMNNPAVASILKNPIVQDVAKNVSTATSFVNALANGNAGQALGAFSGELSKLPANPQIQKTLGLLDDGAKIADALHSGDYAKAFGGLASGLQQMGSSPEAARLNSSLGQVPKLLEAAGSGNPQAVVEALRGKNGQDGFLQEIGGGGLSKAFSGVADLAGRTLDSPRFQQAADLAQAGTRFFSALGSGQLGQAIASAAGQGASLGQAAAQLSGLLDAGAPMAHSMATGQFQQALAELRNNELSSGLARRLASLGPLADLVTGRTQAAVQVFQRDLARTQEIQYHLDKFEGLERFTRDMEVRFAQASELADKGLL